MVAENKPRKKPLMDKQYYLDVIDCMPNIIYLLDKNCVLTGCNLNFREFFGIKQNSQVLGSSPYKVLVNGLRWSQEFVEKLKRDDIHAILSGEPYHNEQASVASQQEANCIFYQMSRFPLFKNKEVIGLVVIIADVTEKKRLEEQLEKIKQQLQASNKQSAANFTQDNQSVKLDRPPKVLMVEDNTVAQKAAQALLMQLDCHVDVADSGDKALELFQPGKYDLVFMDIGLEDTSGYVVSKRIRQLEKGTDYHVPIIALTGYEADIVQYDCIDYSMEGALTKPLTMEQAKQIIQHYIYHIDIPVRGLKNLKGYS